MTVAESPTPRHPQRGREPIHITFHPALRAERDNQRAAFIANRDQADNDLWTLWKSQRQARSDRDRMWRDAP